MKILGRIDGKNYYFKKKSNWYYKRLNHNVTPKLYKATCALLNTTKEKDTVIKALEYILDKEKKSDLKKYKQKDVIKMAQNKNIDNIIYKYVNSLSIW